MMRHLPSPRFQSQGFTLVEILIVISVCALLAAILLPAFNKVKNSARTSTCASNLRQIGIGFRQYVEDNKGFHPSLNVIANPDCEWAEQIYPYLRSTAIFRCPSFEYGDFRPGCPASEPTNDPNFPFRKWDGSYNLNFFSFGFNEMRLRRPSETILFCDGDGGRSSYGSTSLAGSISGVPDNTRDFSHYGNRHNEGINVAYADGHTKWKSYEALLDAKQWQPR